MDWNTKVIQMLGCIFLLMGGSLGAEELSFSRPVPEGGGPTKIMCSMAITDVDDISDAEQNFTVNVFTVFRWNDPRLAHSGEGNLKKLSTEIWHPNLIFLNRQRIWASMGNFLEVTPEGDVIFRQQFWGDFSQPLNLHDFPFDRQTFGIQVISTSSISKDDVVIVPNPDVDSFVTENYSVVDWKIIDHAVDLSPHALPSGVEIPSFKLTFTAERLSTHFIIKVIAPLLMIMMLSCVVFWLSPSEGGSQLGVAVTSCLTVIAYHVALSSKLPEISYLTQLDVFVFWVTILVFLAMIEVVVTTGLAQKGKEKGARMLDRICRVVFPCLVVLGACYAFLWH